MRSIFVAASSVSADCRTASVILRAMEASSGRLLLRDAVERTAAAQDMARRQTHHIVAGEVGFVRVEGALRASRAVGRHDDRSVADQEVHAAGGNDNAILVFDTARRRDTHDLEETPAGVALVLELGCD